MSQNTNVSFDKWLLLPRVLIAVIAIALVIAVLRYQKTVFPISEIKTPEISVANFAANPLLSTTQPLSFYTDLVSQRDIFRFDRQAPVITELASSPVSQDFSTKFILQGIVLDKNPQVIVKDIQSGKVHFVHRMQTLDGATLKEIQSNKAVFSLAGETLELIKK
ncbi:MAG: hypothetical protein H6754_02840 [Candidatus Omnitrophica bacterium]|nr:hypothetical protein [Candidatus Omnitrophota bacterium]